MAAGSATQSINQVEKVKLRVMVDKERNEVMYAEAGKDFVDVLLSFLTLPLGTIAKLLSKESNIEAMGVGSLSSLYQSVAHLDEQYLLTPTCKEMLLKPRNFMADYCRKLKLNIDDTEPLQYFRCKYWDCNREEDGGCFLSTFKNQKCSCGQVMDIEVSPPELLNVENGFVRETATFIISDDLHVMPNVFGATLCLFQKLRVANSNNIQEETVDITKKEVTDILKLSLLSKTPLTDFIFKKKQFLGDSKPRVRFEIDNRKVVSSDDARQMDLKVMMRKSNGEILFAEAEEDFADFLFSFLTFPIGGVLHMLEGFTLGCMNNIHESMKELSPDRYLISHDLKNKLTKPQIAPHFNLTNQILPIGASSLPQYYCHTYYNGSGNIINVTKEMIFECYVSDYEQCMCFNFIDPKSSFSRSSSCGEFAKGPSTYMVTDNLVVTPMSSASAMLYLNGSNVPLFDLEEKIIKIGIKEGLAILKASLISANALTKGLSQFLMSTEDLASRRSIKW